MVCVLRAWWSWMGLGRLSGWLHLWLVMTVQKSLNAFDMFASNYYMCLCEAMKESHWKWHASHVYCLSVCCVAGTKSLILRIRIKCIQPNGNAFQTEIKWNPTDGYAYEMHSKMHQRKVDSQRFWFHFCRFHSTTTRLHYCLRFLSLHTKSFSYFIGFSFFLIIHAVCNIFTQ